MTELPATGEKRAPIRCDGCGVDVTDCWEGGPSLTKLCFDCAEEAWDEDLHEAELAAHDMDRYGSLQP